MGPQTAAFLAGEGKAWLERNINKKPSDDGVVLKAIRDTRITPGRVMEIGCASGWRLKQLVKKYECEAFGVDPGITHFHETNGILFYRGAAHDLHLFKDNTFDLLIYGFCLYLCDPEDYFTIAMEGDRILKDNGHIIIHDFYSMEPFKRKYKHKDGLFSHHWDFRQMWAWHPHYRCIGNYAVPNVQESVAILKKQTLKSFEMRHE